MTETNTIAGASTRTARGIGLALDTLSPVNQKGHFEFDRVIKSGEVLKKTRKTRSWRTVYLVLRPGLLSIYRNPNETKLRHKISLSDLTAIARQRDPKGKAKHVFGLFLPSRNYHLGAKDDAEAQDWVESIRREASMNDEEADMALKTPGGRGEGTYTGFGRVSSASPPTISADHGALSSSDETWHTSPAKKLSPSRIRRQSTTLDYSGPENASYSDFSDAMGPSARLSMLSVSRSAPLAIQEQRGEESAVASGGEGAGDYAQVDHQAQEEMEARATVADLQATARIICQDWILLLRSLSGVKKWKRVWMVLRSRSLAIYKDEEECSALQIIPFADIVDAVEMDPISHSKRFCMQVITEVKTHRFCARDEDNLATWLGSLKSLVVKRRERATSSVTAAQ